MTDEHIDSDIDNSEYEAGHVGNASEADSIKMEWYRAQGLDTKAYITPHELAVLLLPSFETEFEAMRHSGRIQFAVANHPVLKEIWRAVAGGEVESETVGEQIFLNKNCALVWANKTDFDMPDVLRIPVVSIDSSQTSHETSSEATIEGNTLPTKSFNGTVRVEEAPLEILNEIVDRKSGYDIIFCGKAAHLKKCRGTAILMELLHSPNKAIDALVLDTAQRLPLSEDSEVIYDGFGDSDGDLPLADAQTIQMIKKLIEQAQLARELGNVEEADQITEKVETLHKEYIRPGGQSRITRGERSKAVDRIQKAIDRGVLERLEKQHPDLYSHFKASIKFGSHPSYQPTSNIDWVLPA